MADWKWCTVYWQVGATWELRMLCTTVILDEWPNMTPPATTLTPRLARIAAMKAVEQDHGVWVFDAEVGYALYPESHRKLDRDDLKRFTIEVYERVEV